MIYGNRVPMRGSDSGEAPVLNCMESESNTIRGSRLQLATNVVDRRRGQLL